MINKITGKVVELMVVALMIVALMIALSFTAFAQNIEQEDSQIEPLRRRPGVTYAMSVEPARLMRGNGFDYDHEIRIGLPRTYHVQPDKTFPVLWLTDGAMWFNLTLGVLDTLTLRDSVQEMIVVSVGAPLSSGFVGLGRRNIEFAPPSAQRFYSGVGGDYMRQKYRELNVENWPQKADHFLSFLVDKLRPELAKSYRMSDEHGLFGHSGGGGFAGYALFARPQAFDKYIIGSPSINASDRAVFRMEQDYAKKNKDFNVSLFLGAGDREVDDLDAAAWGVVSAPVLLAETLRLRQYPSLKLTTRIYSGKDHLTVVPAILMDGIKTLWDQSSASSSNE